ncbi:MAG: FecR family protein [Spirochaetaceae bacterium]|nr:FecR family protein [Spirochaetaceae bacterium]
MVEYVEGSVTIDGKDADFGQVLPKTATVVTGAGSYCDIVFGGKNAFRIGQNAIVKLDFRKTKPEIGLVKGGVTSVLRKLEKLAGKDTFVVRTQSAIAAVRGTSFCVWANESSTYVCACNGVVRTLDAKGRNEQTLESSHHVARLYQTLGKGFSVEAAGILHHDDALVESVASRIGEIVDWNIRE